MALPAEMPADLQKAITFFCEKDPEDLQLNDVLGVTEIMALCSAHHAITTKESNKYEVGLIVCIRMIC